MMMPFSVSMIYERTSGIGLDVLHRSLSIDDEVRALRVTVDRALLVRFHRAPRRQHLSAKVGEEDMLHLVCLRECFERGDVIGTDTHDLGAGGSNCGSAASMPRISFVQVPVNAWTKV
jgi:hypothetical protein